MQKRPWRVDFFQRFAGQISARSGKRPVHVLELGSGPGFLAQHLLESVDNIDRYVALDFSPAMHELAQARLGGHACRVEFVERDFLQECWSHGLGSFDVVVTHQAVHELRHKRHAVAFHRQVATLLNRSGAYLVCDHHAGDGGMKNTELYMRVDEQSQALLQAGFKSVALVHQHGGLVLHSAVSR